MKKKVKKQHVHGRFWVVKSVLEQRLSLEKGARLALAREIVESLNKRDRAAKAKEHDRQRRMARRDVSAGATE